MSIMLPNDFDSLAEAARPYGLTEALNEIAGLIRANPRWNEIDTRRLARLHAEPYILTRAITFLVSAGVLRQLYAVTTPSGVLADDRFEEPSDIPAKLPDRFEADYFDTSGQDIVPVLVSPRR